MNKNVHDEIRQKLVYHSTLCFFRSFDLMLAYISLNDKRFHTWSEVTAYYSKFYIIKAISFLLQRGFVTIDFDKRGKLVDAKYDSNFYFFITRRDSKFTILIHPFLINFGTIQIQKLSMDHIKFCGNYWKRLRV
ncbi:hydrolase [Oceanobacillus picturae]|uniref:Hydrolase n=1 Tax=Oceanobacillus picturae TaxID=171693 RepID=A0A0U9H981_9BACI|nr:hydrolase [Oceanobacillus picturae]